MINHPNRSPKLLSAAAISRMDAYVDSIIAECLGENETFPLGVAWREASVWTEASLIAAAIIYRAEALSDPRYRVLERGDLADERLCAVADELHLA